jgi:hypothetical protein
MGRDHGRSGHRYMIDRRMVPPGRRRAWGTHDLPPSLKVGTVASW